MIRWGGQIYLAYLNDDTNLINNPGIRVSLLSGGREEGPYTLSNVNKKIGGNAYNVKWVDRTASF